MNAHKAGGRGYALAFVGPLSALRTALDDGPVRMTELARTYRHIPAADLTRVRLHENTDDPELWLIRAAAYALEDYLNIEDDWVSYREEIDGSDLRYEGREVYAFLPEDQTPYAQAHKQFGDPFNLQSGRFAENIRDAGDVTELRESMRAHGWVPQFPAIVDEWGVVLVGNRRMQVARELGITPVVSKITLGEGDQADAQRLKLAIVSNIAAKPFTPNERKRLAEYLYKEHNWSQQRVAEALHVGQKTISRDLEQLVTTTNSKEGKQKRGRPRKPLPPLTQQAFEAAKDYAAKTGEQPTLNAIRAATGLGITPVRHAIAGFEAVESEKADDSDPYRQLVEELVGNSERPMTRLNVVNLIQRLQQRLDEG